MAQKQAEKLWLGAGDQHPPTATRHKMENWRAHRGDGLMETVQN